MVSNELGSFANYLIVTAISDQAQAAEGGAEIEDDPRRLRPGEIDPNPHVKPARPDAVDMEEDGIHLSSGLDTRTCAYNH